MTQATLTHLSEQKAYEIRVDISPRDGRSLEGLQPTNLTAVLTCNAKGTQGVLRELELEGFTLRAKVFESDICELGTYVISVQYKLQGTDLNYGAEYISIEERVFCTDRKEFRLAPTGITQCQAHLAPTNSTAPSAGTTATGDSPKPEWAKTWRDYDSTEDMYKAFIREGERLGYEYAKTDEFVQAVIPKAFPNVELSEERYRELSEKVARAVSSDRYTSKDEIEGHFMREYPDIYKDEDIMGIVSLMADLYLDVPVAQWRFIREVKHGEFLSKEVQAIQKQLKGFDVVRFEEDVIQKVDDKLATLPTLSTEREDFERKAPRFEGERAVFNQYVGAKLYEAYNLIRSSLSTLGKPEEPLKQEVLELYPDGFGKHLGDYASKLIELLRTASKTELISLRDYEMLIRPLVQEVQAQRHAYSTLESQYRALEERLQALETKQ